MFLSAACIDVPDSISLGDYLPDAGNSVSAASIQVSISAPVDGSVLYEPRAEVSGHVTSIRGVHEVFVNGLPTPLNGGYFASSATLQPGLNTVVVAAKDADGISASAEVRVTYVAPGQHLSTQTLIPATTVSAGELVPVDCAAVHQNVTLRTTDGTLDDPRDWEVSTSDPSAFEELGAGLFVPQRVGTYVLRCSVDNLPDAVGATIHVVPGPVWHTHPTPRDLAVGAGDALDVLAGALVTIDCAASDRFGNSIGDPSLLSTLLPTTGQSIGAVAEGNQVHLTIEGEWLVRCDNGAVPLPEALTARVGPNPNLADLTGDVGTVASWRVAPQHIGEVRSLRLGVTDTHGNELVIGEPTVTVSIDEGSGYVPVTVSSNVTPVESADVALLHRAAPASGRGREVGFRFETPGQYRIGVEVPIVGGGVWQFVDERQITVHPAVLDPGVSNCLQPLEADRVTALEGNPLLVLQEIPWDPTMPWDEVVESVSYSGQALTPSTTWAPSMGQYRVYRASAPPIDAFSRESAAAAAHGSLIVEAMVAAAYGPQWSEVRYRANVSEGSGSMNVVVPHACAHHVAPGFTEGQRQIPSGRLIIGRDDLNGSQFGSLASRLSSWFNSEQRFLNRPLESIRFPTDRKYRVHFVHHILDDFSTQVSVVPDTNTLDVTFGIRAFDYGLFEISGRRAQRGGFSADVLSFTSRGSPGGSDRITTSNFGEMRTHQCTNEYVTSFPVGSRGFSCNLGSTLLFDASQHLDDLRDGLLSYLSEEAALRWPVLRRIVDSATTHDPPSTTVRIPLANVSTLGVSTNFLDVSTERVDSHPRGLHSSFSAGALAWTFRSASSLPAGAVRTRLTSPTGVPLSELTEPAADLLVPIADSRLTYATASMNKLLELAWQIGALDATGIDWDVVLARIGSSPDQEAVSQLAGLEVDVVFESPPFLTQWQAIQGGVMELSCSSIRLDLRDPFGLRFNGTLSLRMGIDTRGSWTVLLDGGTPVVYVPTTYTLATYLSFDRAVDVARLHRLLGRSAGASADGSDLGSNIAVALSHGLDHHLGRILSDIASSGPSSLSSSSRMWANSSSTATAQPIAGELMVDADVQFRPVTALDVLGASP